MENERTNAEQLPDPQRTITEPEPEQPAFSVANDLRKLNPGSQIMITRLAPKYAEGYLDHLTVPDEGIDNVLDDIRQSFGGGVFNLQTKVKSGNGKLVFGSRATTVRIAGEPTLNGRRYVNGELEKPAAVAPVQPFMMPNPGHGNALDGLQTQLLGLVQQALSGSREGGAAVDVVGLLKAFQGLSGGAPPRDSFGDLERSLGIIGKLQKTFQGGNATEEKPASDGGLEGLLGGEMSLEKLLMFKMLGIGGGGGSGGGLEGLFGQRPPQQPPQPPPLTAEQQWQQAGGAQWSQTQAAGQPPPIPGGVRQVQYPPDPGPVSHATPPTPAPHPPQPVPSSGVVNPGGGGPPSPDVSQADPGYEPISVDELCQELHDKSEPERLAFLGELCQRIGFDEQVLSALSSKLGPTTQNGAAEQFPGSPPVIIEPDPPGDTKS